MQTNQFHSRCRAVPGLVAGLAISLSAWAGELSWWPGASLDESIPDLESVVGHDHGEVISSPAALTRYLEALHAAAPQRTRLVKYATSWEGRPLNYLMIASAGNMARLDAIQTGLQRLADPRGLAEDEAGRLLDRLPALVWLSYGVHGNEISSGDAALLLARYLLAADDPLFRQILDEVVVVIDPAQNPDGRARFVAHYQQHAGLAPAASPLAAERREAWPGGRTNHYLFDMNRDWFALTQPETRGRVRALLDWYPQIHVDVHEMGTDRTYYFPPPAEPWNPHITEAQKRGLETLGKGIAAQFDRFGFDYFNREVYDALYPGYGDSWPGFHGTLGMTFEMASARGLVAERSDGSLVTYEDGVHRHFVATVGTLMTAARERRTLLETFLEFRRAALDDDNVYVFPAGNDPQLVQRLAQQLAMQGVEVATPRDRGRICGEEVGRGDLVVRAGQPAGRLVRTLLDPHNPLAEAYLAEQERRRAKGLEVELYDVLGWSRPESWGMQMARCQGIGRVRLDAFDTEPEVALPPAAKLAYLVPWGGVGAARFLAGALEGGLEVASSTRAFRQGERQLPPGTLLLKVRDNDADVHGQVRELARRTGAQVIVADASWTDAGSSFGSRHVRSLAAPRIALAWDEPTRSYGAGATRYVLERQLAYPVTPVRVADLVHPKLADFDVLILPQGGDYLEALGKSGFDWLKTWVGQGGTLVALGRATRSVVKAGMLKTQREWRTVEGDAGDAPAQDKARVPGLVIEDEAAYQSLLAAKEAAPDTIPGVLLRAVADPDHWLTAGLDRRQVFMVTGSDVYRPLARDAGVNVVRFTAAGELVAGGHLWEENRQQWAYKPVVMVAAMGEGHVIAFTADPTFRGFMDGLLPLFASAVLRGPGYGGY